MDVTLSYVCMKDADGKYTNGAFGFYVNDRDEALAHAKRIGGVVIEFTGKEVTDES